jgi:hypothetical protein
MTLKELIQRAVEIASGGGPADQLEIMAEALVPSTFRFATRQAAKDPVKRAAVTVQHTITLANGVGTLPTEVLVEFLDHSTIADPADAAMARKMRRVYSWNEFIRPLDNSLGYYIVTGTNKLHLTRPGTSYNPVDGMDGDVVLTTPTVPTVPALNSQIVAPAEIVDDILLALAAGLTGKWQQAEEVKGSGA